ncbi:MAG TPA: chemotaxis protein CheX [Anaeromyxobacteraceae bacterium]|nr:chemotaxis protein CheX [Anaeromyxobacteraceae bacterium]
MSAELSAELLAQALSRTLEEAAFVFAEPTQDPPPLEGEVIEARLSYRGDHEGELRLAAPASFAASLAANLLGEEEGSQGAKARGDDCIGELLNMIAGALAVDLFGPGSRCLLGLPRVRRVAAEEHAQALATAHAAATLIEEEGGRIDLSASISQGASK